MIGQLLEQIINQRRAMYFLMVFIMVLGCISLNSLPSDVYPELAFPRIAVIATVGDMEPDRVLLTLTRPLEEAASQVYKVRWIRSKSVRGASELSIEFQPGTDMNFAWQQMQARIAEVKSALPPSTTLIVEPVTPAIFPILNYNITSDVLSAADLYNLVRYEIEPRIVQVPGVARAITQAGKIPEVAIQVEPEKLKSYRLSISDVANSVARTNQIEVLGRVDDRFQQNLIVGPGEARVPGDLRGLVIARNGSEPVFLKDLASISNAYKDPVSVISADGKEGIVINIFRQPNSNVVAVSDGVARELEAIKNNLPKDVNIKKAYDESRLVRQALLSIFEEIGIGIFLILAILFAFLRSWKSTLIAATTIPLSAAASFVAMSLLGQSLNLMSLGGMAIALGLVIDDAIVIVENMHRQLASGLSPIQAAKFAVTELAAPVTSSTATTLVVFLPLGLISGVTGQFFSALTVTLASAVAFSLFLALFVIPILCAQWLRDPVKDQAERLEAIAAVPKTSLWYRKAFRSLLYKPVLAIILALVILGVTIALYQKVGTDFLPEMDEGSYVLDYLMPAGTSLQQTNSVCNRIEEILAKTPEVAAWTRRTGAELGLFATQPNTGDILIVLKTHNERNRTTSEVMDEQREQIAESIPEVETEFHPILADQLNDLAGAGNPVEVRVFGENSAAIRAVAETIQENMLRIKGLVDVAVTSQDFSPQFEIKVDPWRAGRLALNPLDVTDQVKDAMLGRVSTKMKQGDKFVDVRVRYPDSVRLDAQQLGKINIFGKNGTILPLYSLSSIKQIRGETEILREHQQRYVAVEASIAGRDLGSTIAEVTKQISTITLPAGVTVTVGGIYLSQQETFKQLLLVLLLATALVYLMMVIQFKSFLQPLAILVVLPLGFLGVEVALIATHTPLNVSSFMGLILLVGLVVKNGIILLEYSNRLESSGASTEDALVEAVSIRLRPIMMTTLCTLLALMPLWLGHGAGSELHRPLAIAVIGGLSLSTVFTLMFVPLLSRFLHHSSKDSRTTKS
ncbi:MAG: efflux RND transporter permease subunit [Leptolyngbya sp.]|nr:efflux RND transporter permease subunit [Candidatus Melainabacteria bacterium]